MAEITKLFEGSGGGNSTPTSTPDSLFSEDVIELALAISEGPIRGLTKGAKSFYVGNTPLISQDGTLNFKKFAVGVHPGYPEGMAKELNLVLGGESSNTAVGVTLFSQTPVTRQTDSILRGKIDTLEVRINFARLLRTDSKGNYRHTATFKLEYKATQDSNWRNFYSDSVISLEGKTSSGVVKEFSVSVPRINDDYQIRVTKISPDSNETDFVDMVFDSFQMITKGPRAYPDTAVIHLIGVSTGQLSSVPDLMGIYDGLLVRVPTNYNPDTRTYDDSVPWNGSFKFAWTDNPAWILYDMIVNPRYGLAAHRVHVDANRFDFYLAARWCDTPVLVNDGPETRPRFTFNDIIVEPRPAMEMLNYVAGSFNAIVWDDLQGQIHLKVDKDDPAVAIFTPENVTESGFEYTFTDITTRANDISVSFVNPDLDWNEDRRRIPNVTTNEDAIAKFGRVPLDFIAVGCTNAHEAVAKAQVRLISALTETTMVSFTTTRQGALLGLLDILLVADPLMGWSQSGRLTTYDSEFLNFRDPIFIEEMKHYVVKLQTVDGIVEVNVEPEEVGEVRRLKLLSALPANIPRYTVFALEDTSGFGLAKPFRVTSVEEVDGSPYQFRVSAIEVNRNKYTQAETNTNLAEIQYSYRNPALPGAPSNFRAETGGDHVFLDPVTGLTITRIFCSWTRPFNVVVAGYELQYQRVGTDYDWTQIPGITTESVYVSPAEPGVDYSLRVCAVNPNGRKSAWVTISPFTAEGAKVKPDTLASFTATGDLFQNILHWQFGEAANILNVEVWGANVDDVTHASKLADLSYPTNTWTHLGLSMGVTVYYWLRVKNTSRVLSDFTSPSRSATTISNPDRLTQILQDTLGTDTLLPELRSRIDLIDADASNPLSVNARLLEEAQARIQAVNTEITERSNAIQAEAQTRAATVLAESQARMQAINDEVATRANAIQVETQARIAAVLAEAQSRDAAISAETSARVDALAAEAQARGTAITNESTTRQSQYNSLASSITTLSATTENNLAAAIQTEQSARANGDSAVTQAMTTLVSQTQSNLQASITSESNTRASQDNALASSISTLSATTANNLAAAIQTEQSARADGDSAVTQSLTTLVSQTQSSLQAAITSESNTRSSQDSALASSISTLSATTANNLTAAIQAEQSARTDGDSAVTQALTTLVSQTQSDLQAAITSESSTRTSQDSALASSISTLSATTANNLSAAIQTEQTARTAGDSAVTQALTTLVSQTQSDLQAAITSESNTRTSQDSALASSISTLSATTANNLSAAIQTEQSARSDGDATLASSISSLSATTASNLTAAIQTEQSARADGDSAVTQAMTALVSQTKSDLQASITSETTARTNQDTALSSSLTAVTTRVGSAETAISTETTARTNAVSAVAVDLSNLTGRVGANEASIGAINNIDVSSTSAVARAAANLTSRMGAAESAIVQINTVSSNSTSAVANSVASLTTRVGNNESAITAINNVSVNSTSAVASAVANLTSRMGTAESAIVQINTISSSTTSAVASSVYNLSSRLDSAESSISQINTVTSNSGSAIARSVSTLNTTVGTNSASISTLQSTMNGVTAQVYVKTDVNGYVSGFGLYNSGATSEFVINASKFVIATPGYTNRYPFIVSTINGTSVIAMNGAIIADNTISAHALSVTSLSAITANIGEVTAGVARSSSWDNYINFNARPGTTDSFIVAGAGQMILRANGSGYFARNIVSSPDIVASGTTSLDSGWIGMTYSTDSEGVSVLTPTGLVWWIPTGVYVGSSWSTATSDMYAASATIAGGDSQSGGTNGYSKAEVVVGDGLSTSSFTPYDNQIYVKFTWEPGGNGTGTIRVTSISWKLARI